MGFLRAVESLSTTCFAAMVFVHTLVVPLHARAADVRVGKAVATSQKPREKSGEPASRAPVASGEVIDPDEVIGPGEDISGPFFEGNYGDWNPARPSSLCIVHGPRLVHTFLLIPYGYHENWRPCFGSRRLGLEYEEFFRVAERPDLMERQNARATLKTVLVFTELGLALAGLPIATAGFAGGNLPVGFVGSGMLLGALVLDVVDGSLSPLAVSSAEAQQAADSFNVESARDSPLEEEVLGATRWTVNVLAGTF